MAFVPNLRAALLRWTVGRMFSRPFKRWGDNAQVEYRFLLIQLGQSVERRLIEAHLFRGTPVTTTLVLGAMHGDEPKTVTVATRFVELLSSEPALRVGRRWVVVPTVNPDGYVRRRRRNAHGVDINRNFPTKNWQRTPKRGRMYGGEVPASEPETVVVMEAISRYRPDRIITLHSIDGRRQCNNFDGPAKRLARCMARWNGYPVAASIGYPTPGSFGTYAGRERGIATITLELPSHHSPKRCWEDNWRALLC